MASQFTLYSHAGGPNGWKVAIILEELGLTYETKFLEFGSTESPNGLKSDTYLKINPNGRIPALIDHRNNDFVIWESMACILYLLEKYDKEGKISVTGEDHFKQYQWLAFQISGQGVPFGQAAWFQYFHKEKLPSAIERYQNEIVRVLGVIELHLKQTGQNFLLGEKATASDLAFITWNLNFPGLVGDKVKYVLFARILWYDLVLNAVLCPSASSRIFRSYISGTRI
ncbi:glutathione S- transferase, nitrogen catabolite repression regulator [Cystobasidiomycetes sp. EMM_F5]